MRLTGCAGDHAWIDRFPSQKRLLISQPSSVRRMRCMSKPNFTGAFCNAIVPQMTVPMFPLPKAAHVEIGRGLEKSNRNAL